MDSNSNSSPPESNQDYDDMIKSAGDFGFSLGIVLAVFFLAAIMACCSKPQNSQTPTATSLSRRPTPSGGGASIQHEGLTAAAISAFPKCTYAQLNPLKTSSGCAVCLGDYKERETLRLLPDCGHIFHRSCIDPWLIINPTCPICRNSITAAQPAAPVANQ
ncbi:hypothetical protein C2S52_019374 [Perilla frutescens var. hirtella]|nr:hypothetical protein C2S52_019374 [Perilla frutescens var. hirtella]KAH6806350.1 hypothetical protein C2S51_031181 [Perilla frutescens var. frutescens]